MQFVLSPLIEFTRDLEFEIFSTMVFVIRSKFNIYGIIFEFDLSDVVFRESTIYAQHIFNSHAKIFLVNSCFTVAFLVLDLNFISNLDFQIEFMNTFAHQISCALTYLHLRLWVWPLPSFSYTELFKCLLFLWKFKLFFNSNFNSEKVPSGVNHSF